MSVMPDRGEHVPAQVMPEYQLVQGSIPPEPVATQALGTTTPVPPSSAEADYLDSLWDGAPPHYTTD
jgi:hypothetical protein